MNDKKKFTQEPVHTVLVVKRFNSVQELGEIYPIGSILIKEYSSEASDIWWKVNKIDEYGVHCTLHQVIPPHIKKLPIEQITISENIITRDHSEQRVLPKHIKI